MIDIKRVSLAFLAPLMILSMPLAGQADDIVRRTTVIETTGNAAPGSTSISVTAVKTYSLKFKERLKNLNESADNAKAKGWINADEYATFKSEIGRLTTLEAQVEAAGFPKPDLDDLEKQITKLNSDLSSASNKQPKATSSAAATTTTTKTTKTKSASGDVKAKTTTKKTTSTK